MTNYIKIFYTKTIDSYIFDRFEYTTSVNSKLLNLYGYSEYYHSDFGGYYMVVDIDIFIEYDNGLSYPSLDLIRTVIKSINRTKTINKLLNGI